MRSRRAGGHDVIASVAGLVRSKRVARKPQQRSWPPCALRQPRHRPGRRRLSALQDARDFRAPFFDLVLFAHHWGFEIANIKVPVRFWHGQADAIIPTSHSAHQALLIKDSKVIYKPGMGHFAGYTELAVVFNALLSAWPERLVGDAARDHRLPQEVAERAQSGPRAGRSACSDGDVARRDVRATQLLNVHRHGPCIQQERGRMARHALRGVRRDHRRNVDCDKSPTRLAGRSTGGIAS
jgi:hypothetical protein